MEFPERIGVEFVLRKIAEERIGDDVWLTYAVEQDEAIQFDFQIAASSFGPEDMTKLREALAQDILERLSEVTGSAVPIAPPK
jgi:hypothetical protein